MHFLFSLSFFYCFNRYDIDSGSYATVVKLILLPVDITLIYADNFHANITCAISLKFSTYVHPKCKQYTGIIMHVDLLTACDINNRTSIMVNPFHQSALIESTNWRTAFISAATSKWICSPIKLLPSFRYCRFWMKWIWINQIAYMRQSEQKCQKNLNQPFLYVSWFAFNGKNVSAVSAYVDIDISLHGDFGYGGNKTSPILVVFFFGYEFAICKLNSLYKHYV